MDEPKIITDLTPEKYRQEFIRMSQFVFNRETEDIRSDLLQSVIISSLYTDKENKGMTIDDIIRSTKEILSLPFTIVEELLEKMSEEDKVISKNGKYFLAESEKAKISQIIQERTSKSNSIYEKLILKIRERYGELSKDQENQITNNFQLLLAYIFTRDSTLSVRTILGGIKEHILEPTDIEPIINYVLASTWDKNLRDLQREVIGELFLGSDEETRDFLYSTAQNYISMQILNLDPNCLIVQKFSLSKKVVFLDTNIIIGLSCPSQRENKVVKNLLKLMADLGIKVKFTSRTKEELIRVLNHSNDRYNILSKKLKDNQFQKLVEEVDDPFTMSYWIKKKSHPGLSWDGYYYRLPKKMNKILNQFSIALDEKSYEDVKSHPSMIYVHNLVLGCAKTWGENKPRGAAQHDAFHILLIKELRKKEPRSFLGPDHWFVTRDRSLYCVDQKMKDGEYPYTAKLDVWFSTLCPFMPLVTFNKKKRTIEEIFMHFMASVFIPSSRVIDSDTLIGIIDWIDFESLTVEEIMDITSKKFIKDYVKEVQEAREQGKEPKNNIKKIKAITKEVDETLKRKIEGITGELKELKTTMKQKDDTIMKIKSYFLVTILLLFIVIDSFLYVISKNLTLLEIAIGGELAFLFGIPSIRSWIRESVS